MSRQDQWRLGLTVDGVDLGVWDTKSGGAITSEETTYRPGGMAPLIALGGAVTVEALTIGRLFDRVRDGARIHWLIGRCGKGDVTVQQQPLDVDGNAFGRPITYTGRLQAVTPPEVDSNSSDAATVEIAVTPSGTVT